MSMAPSEEMAVSGENQPLIKFDAEGRLTLSFGLYNERWREPVCVECGEPIRWVLDMFSFQQNRHGGYDLGHAWCLWTPEGFEEPQQKAEAVSGRTEGSDGR